MEKELVIQKDLIHNLYIMGIIIQKGYKPNDIILSEKNEFQLKKKLYKDWQQNQFIAMKIRHHDECLKDDKDLINKHKTEMHRIFLKIRQNIIKLNDMDFSDTDITFKLSEVDSWMIK